MDETLYENCFKKIEVDVDLKKINESLAKIEQTLSERFHPKDDLLGGITFEELIMTVETNERVKDEKAVKKVFLELVKGKLHDADVELKSNMKEILSSLNESAPKESKVNEAKTPEEKIDTLRNIIKRKQFAKVDGTTVDLTTANAIITVYDKLNPQNKEKFARMPIPKMVSIVWKVLG